MAQTFLTQDELKALDSTRSRLFQLSTSIGTLKVTLEQGNPLPPWSSMQASTAIVAQQIRTIAMQLAKQASLLNRTVVYPATNFPGRTQSGVLGNVVRKKLEPAVDTWVEQARVVEVGGNATSDKEEEELWKWAEKTFEERIVRYVNEEAGDSYTIEERESGVEHVNTGLKRKPDEDEDDDDEEDDESDEDEAEAGGARKKVKTGPAAVMKDPNRPGKSLEAMSKWATSGWEYQPARPKKR